MGGSVGDVVCMGGSVGDVVWVVVWEMWYGW